MLLSLDESGSSIELRHAAQGRLVQHQLAALAGARQLEGADVASRKRNFPGFGATAAFTWARFSRLPVEKLYRPTDALPVVERCSTGRADEAGAPVTSQRRGLRLMCCSTSSYLLTLTPCRAFDEGGFRSGRPWRVPRTAPRPSRALARPCAARSGASVRAARQSASARVRRSGTAALAPGADNLGGAADVGVNHRRRAAIPKSRRREKVSTAVLHSAAASQGRQRPHVLLQAGDHHAVGDPAARARASPRRASARRRSAARAGTPRRRSMATASTHRTWFYRRAAPPTWRRLNRPRRSPAPGAGPWPLAAGGGAPGGPYRCRCRSPRAAPNTRAAASSGAAPRTRTPGARRPEERPVVQHLQHFLGLRTEWCGKSPSADLAARSAAYIRRNG